MCYAKFSNNEYPQTFAGGSPRKGEEKRGCATKLFCHEDLRQISSSRGIFTCLRIGDERQARRESIFEALTRNLCPFAATQVIYASCDCSKRTCMRGRKKRNMRLPRSSHSNGQLRRHRHRMPVRQAGCRRRSGQRADAKQPAARLPRLFDPGSAVLACGKVEPLVTIL